MIGTLCLISYCSILLSNNCSLTGITAPLCALLRDWFSFNYYTGSCGVSSVNNGRVIGGADAIPGAWPWQVCKPSVKLFYLSLKFEIIHPLHSSIGFSIFIFCLIGNEWASGLHQAESRMNRSGSMAELMQCPLALPYPARWYNLLDPLHSEYSEQIKVTQKKRVKGLNVWIRWKLVYTRFSLGGLSTPKPHLEPSSDSS